MGQPTGSPVRQQVIDNFGRLASQVLSRDVGEVSARTRLREELGMTSTTIIELMLELENLLHLEVDVELLDEPDAASVGALADFVEAHARPVG
jgi:acyl carrier protein